MENPDKKITKDFLQGLVDLCVKEDRSASFVCFLYKHELQDLISQIDEKGCRFIKPTESHYSVSVCPQSVSDYIGL